MQLVFLKCYLSYLDPMVAYKCPSDNEIITRQFKFLIRLIIILSRLPVKKVIVTTGRDNALKRHRGQHINTTF